MLTDQNYIEILMHRTLILATLRFTDTNANVKEVSTKYSPGNVNQKIKNNKKKVSVSTLNFFYLVLISSSYEYKVIQIQRI